MRTLVSPVLAMLLACVAAAPAGGQDAQAEGKLMEVEQKSRPPGRDWRRPQKNPDRAAQYEPGTQVQINIRTHPSVVDASLRFYGGTVIPFRQTTGGAIVTFGVSFTATENLSYDILLEDKDARQYASAPYVATIPAGAEPLPFMMGQPRNGLAMGVAALPGEPDRLLLRFENSGREPIRVFWHRSHSCPVQLVSLSDGKQARHYHGLRKNMLSDLVSPRVYVLGRTAVVVDVAVSDFLPAGGAPVVGAVYQLEDWAAPQRRQEFKDHYRDLLASAGVTCLPADQPPPPATTTPASPAAAPARPSAPAPPAAATAPNPPAATGGFASPEEAWQAVLAAMAAGDEDKLKQITTTRGFRWLMADDKGRERHADDLKRLSRSWSGLELRWESRTPDKAAAAMGADRNRHQLSFRRTSSDGWKLDLCQQQ